MNAQTKTPNALDNGNPWQPMSSFRSSIFAGTTVTLDILTISEPSHLTLSIIAEDDYVAQLTDDLDVQYFWRLSNRYSKFEIPKIVTPEVPVDVKVDEPEWIAFRGASWSGFNAGCEYQFKPYYGEISPWVTDMDEYLAWAKTISISIDHYRSRPVAAPAGTPNSSKSNETTFEKPKVVSDMPGHTQKMIVVPLTINDEIAEGLAQFLKRVGWSEIRQNAVDDAEAYVIRDALDQVRQALAEVGFSPR